MAQLTEWPHALEPLPESTRSLPRILCLHGGGSNAEIFEFQSRFLRPLLSPHFRLVFANAPFLCVKAGPGILPFFANMEPYRRWLRWHPDEHAEIDDESAIEELEYAMRSEMDEDDRKGGTGEWVGLMGFSQGAKVSASVLLETQLRWDEQNERLPADKAAVSEPPVGIAGGRWRFAVIMNGRAPPVSLSYRSKDSRALSSPGGVAETSYEAFESRERKRMEQWNRSQLTGEPMPPDTEDKFRLRLPTVHVHGLKDPGLELHQWFLRLYMEEGTSTLVEWEGEHRLPLKSHDNQAVVDAILKTARKAGVPLSETRSANGHA